MLSANKFSDNFGRELNLNLYVLTIYYDYIFICLYILTIYYDYIFICIYILTIYAYIFLSTNIYITYYYLIYAHDGIIYYIYLCPTSWKINCGNCGNVFRWHDKKHSGIIIPGHMMESYTGKLAWQVGCATVYSTPNINSI